MRSRPVLLACAAVALLGAAWLLRPGPAVELVLSPGQTVRETAAQLSEKGVVPSARLFRLAAALTGCDRRLKPGSYKLRRNMWLPSLLRQLTLGGNAGLRVVIPEGFDVRQIAERLEAQGVCGADEFRRYAEAQRLEGYLFPTTYFFDPQTPAAKVAARMREEFERQVVPLYDQTRPKPQLSLLQTLTLASIVEREAVLSRERPMIAAVYLNRLRLRMRLQADPTVQYAVGYWKKGLTKSDLQNPSPYNTYVHYGLPPGPICSPGLDSVRAALNPAQTDALYFVADNTGAHAFSTTLEQHTRAERTFKHELRVRQQQQRERAQGQGQN